MDAVWYENTTFSDEPNENSEAAWASLIPDGQGFIRHPTLAKEMKSVSVFHELHCLVRRSSTHPIILLSSHSSY